MRSTLQDRLIYTNDLSSLNQIFLFFLLSDSPDYSPCSALFKIKILFFKLLNEIKLWNAFNDTIDKAKDEAGKENFAIYKSPKSKLIILGIYIALIGLKRTGRYQVFCR